MTNVSNFKKGQILGSYKAGASAAETAELFGVSRITESKVMTAFEKKGKTSPLKLHSRGKRKMSDRDRWTLTRTVRKDYKNAVPKATAELNDHLENPVFSTTIWRELGKASFHSGLQSSNHIKINLWKFLRDLLFCPTPVYIYIYIYIYIYVCVCVCVCVWKWKYICLYEYIWKKITLGLQRMIFIYSWFAKVKCLVFFSLNFHQFKKKVQKI